MAILTVGKNSTFKTIKAAMNHAVDGDTIQLQAGYRNETATVTHQGMTVTGGATSTGIVLHLAAGVPIATFTLAGTAPINVFDNAAGGGIVGNDGNNVVTVTDGVDAVNGGVGLVDRLVVDYHLGSTAVTGDSTSNFADASGRLVTINGGFENFTILTGAGVDTITTGAGDDIINTGEGASTVTAGAGANRITGGTGSDTITALDGGNVVDGGDGANTITTGGGIDIITGGLGADTVNAGGGNDIITVRGGADTIHGEAAVDRLVVNYAASTSVVTMVAPAGTVGAGHNGTIADVSGNNTVYDGIENFTITSGTANDVITTGGGADVVTGMGGRDTLVGGAGIDRLVGGASGDTLTGGADHDVFDFNKVKESVKALAGRDVITDFVHRVDDLDFRTIDADKTTSGNQHFDFIGNAGFSGQAGELHFVKHNRPGTVNDKTFVEGDVNGDGKADFRVELTGNIHLSHVDFIF
jgi:Ca2+-binding RTX toxin-like protein